MKIEVKRITPPGLWRECAAMTTGHDCKMPWNKMLCAMHSPIRASIWLIKMTDIPLFCASQFVRSTQGVQWYQRSKRTDRGGEDFRIECHDFGQRLDIIAENVDEGLSEKKADELTQALGEMENEVKAWSSRFDRYTPTDIASIINAEAIINMSKKRLCQKASKETREIWQAVVSEIAKVDPDLAKHCVKPCVASCGLCREPKGCGFNKTDVCGKLINEYKKLFV